MLIRRTLLLCLITLTLGFTGPFARGLSSQAAKDPAALAVTLAGAASTARTGIAATKNCQRGAMAWSSCSFEIGYVPKILQIDMAFAIQAFGRNVAGTTGDLRNSRLFRPPRLS